MRRQQPAAADAELRVALCATHALDQLDAGPDAAGILPAAAGAAEPLAEDRPRRTSRRSLFLQRAGERCGLAGGAHADAMSAASRFVETARREPLGMSLTLLTISSPRPGPDHAREQIGKRLAGALDARRDDARRDDGGLQQAEVILREVEHLGELRDVRAWRRGRR